MKNLFISVKYLTKYPTKEQLAYIMKVAIIKYLISNGVTKKEGLIKRDKS